MANRRFEQFQFGLEKYKVTLYAAVTFGAAGVPTLGRSKGIASMVRISAGLYDVMFGKPASSTDPAMADLYNLLLFAARTAGPQAGAQASPAFQVVSDSVNTTGKVRILFTTGGVATDPGNGEKMYLEFVLSNQSLGN